MQTPPEQRPPGADAVLEDLRVGVLLLGTYGLSMDSDRWEQRQRDYVRSIIAEAGRRLRERGVITAAEAYRRYVIDGKSFYLRGAERIDCTVIADLAEAIELLIKDELPPVPKANHHWYFGVEGGPRPL